MADARIADFCGLLSFRPTFVREALDTLLWKPFACGDMLTTMTSANFIDCRYECFNYRREKFSRTEIASHIENPQGTFSPFVSKYQIFALHSLAALSTLILLKNLF